MSSREKSATILGLDLGPNSIGWALIQTENTRPVKLLKSGVRVFSTGLDQLEKDGRGKSRNAERREARQARRQTDRRARRKVSLAAALQRAALLPDGDIRDPQMRYRTLQTLDQISDSPYQLRARALDGKLEPFELGRALYHLGQRRGFLSNRRTAASEEKDDKKGKVRPAISQLDDDIKSSHCRTLGEFFSKINPRERRIRTQYTSRQMYLDEFEKIWEAQREHHPHVLTEAVKKSLHRAIFHQRPLKSQAIFIGSCQLEDGRKRAPWALIDAQRFRMLQTVNNLRIINENSGEIRPLTSEERRKVISELDVKADLTFPGLRRLLALSKFTKFNLELGDEKKIPGNRTAERIARIIGKDKWAKLSPNERDALVDDWLSIEKEETLQRRAMKQWGFDSEAARRFAELSLEDGYCNFSRKALKELLSPLEAGLTIQEAIQKKYKDRFERDGLPHPTLPPVECDDMPDLRNPIVYRTLSELRKVVNAIIREHGKPDTIRIELARDLRQTAKQRQETTKKMRANEKAREAALQRIVDEMKIADPSRDDILKVLLADECNWECPYTGKPICMTSLLGPHSQFDVEHIIPFDRCLDDSFMNKTLCYAPENRERKRDRSPYETYHGTDAWDAIIDRVSRFDGAAKYAKLRRFKMTPYDAQELLSEFTSRQLNDTRYASRLAKRYLGLLYGGGNSDGIDAHGKRCVQATPGGVTAFLRNAWGLNGILGTDNLKTRDDHRHHAVDAIVVALTDQGAVKALSDAARRGAIRHRRFEQLEEPWQGFRNDVNAVIKAIVPSHHVSHRVRGALHKGTFYGRPRTGPDGKTCTTTRIKVDELDPKDIDNIIDPAVRDAVEQALESAGGKPKDVFKDPNKHPCLVTSKGIRIPIHKVKIYLNLATFNVGTDDTPRHVVTDTNHHMVVFAVEDKDGKVLKWDAEVVSLFEATQRLKRKQPAIDRSDQPGRRFLFSLSGGDIIQLKDSNGNDGLFVLGTVPKSKQVVFVPIADARTGKEIGTKGLTAYPESLRKRNCGKVVVTLLGEIRTARD